MREHTVDLQVSTPQQDQQRMEAGTSQRQTQGTAPSSVREFIVDDLKLFVSPVTAIVNEFRRQVRL